ncbi:hypothetical protein IWW38_005363 [Coemansia aciculifera]|uniref:Uncharacterized protein n=1 Tax=Coemansia aciculifera TaxID=417176 RepID=A0ACC1LVF7_9FUNG|nr:hypothetical protein IWW38_005363 [Coemansia aciculifera]
MYLIDQSKASTTSLRNEGVVVVNLAPQSQVQHIFNGRLVDPSTGECQHLHECSWDPFLSLETPTFFHTFISESATAYTVTVNLPSYISRYIRVQRSDRTLAVVGKAMARRQWSDGRVNVHELWKVYWRLFRIPVQCDLNALRAWYALDTMKVVIPRRLSILYRTLNWAEVRLWASATSKRRRL